MADVVTRSKKHLLEVSDIHKFFFKNHVLKGISFCVSPGEIAGIVGANGAGKSTLMKIINGVYKQDSGSIFINETLQSYKNPMGAKKAGIAMVYQELSLIPTLTVAQNIFLGTEQKKYGLIQDKIDVANAEHYLKEFGVSIDPGTVVEALPVGQQQMVEVVKALVHNPAALILDEPTASLTVKEISLLFTLIEKLKKQGIAVLLISHHMQEILSICDRVEVLRDGNIVLSDSIQNVTMPNIVTAMIGKKLKENTFIAPVRPIKRDVPLLTVENISFKTRISDISFAIYPGEVLGIAGLMGSGRTEILKCMYGLLQADTGRVIIQGQAIKTGKIWKSIKRGVFLVPEHRRKDGIVGIHSVLDNMVLPSLHKIKKWLFINNREAAGQSRAMQKKLQLQIMGLDQDVQLLSGGNQQKVVFAKGLLTQPKVLLLDEPTVGIDVETKGQMVRLIRHIADARNGIIIVSSEMDEMERICDRVLVLKKGKIIQEMVRDKGDVITEESLSKAIQI